MTSTDPAGAAADTAGLPWAGRTLPGGEFAGDQGLMSPELAAALAQSEPDLPQVVAALAQARVFTAVCAVSAGHEVGGDSGADMAVAVITGPDGQLALPVFSTPGALTRWRPDARPVPVTAPRAALSAVAQGCSVLVLDPAGPVTVVLSRPALWALAQGRRWLPATQDPEVLRELSALAPADTRIAGLTADDRADLRIALAVPAGLAPDALRALAQGFADAVCRSEIIQERASDVAISVTRG